MNNYCSNCGHALEGNEFKCPECGYQLNNQRRVPSRRISWNPTMRMNFTLIITLSLTLILALSSVTGFELYYWSNHIYLGEVAFGMGMFALFLNTVLALIFLFVNKGKFEAHNCSEQQWITSILLFIISIMAWLPYLFAWSQGNW